MDEVLIARIVARVIALLNGQPPGTPPRRILVLFSGATCGVQVGLEAIDRLARAGHSVTVVLSPAAAMLTGEERVRAAGAHKVIGPEVWADAPGLVREADLVLLPTLSMNLATRLALGLLDTLVSTLAIGALLAGKPVIAVRDGADPDGAAGQVFGANGAAPALRARLGGNLKVLASYGVELVRESQFLPTIERRLVEPGQVIRVASQGTSRNGIEAGVITQADLASVEPGGVLHLKAGSRLTPLAHETAARLGIQIVSD
ncbi:MAG: hypothetical protein A2Z04_07940 [Chloroflexi bacterium RBG_16_57_9]|nr:MAG: hypothetical protein A2Z04_07940 [Chloroflexi bacterium RBG_16_57_9]